MNIDLTDLSDEDLDTLRVRVLIEQERRINRERIPESIAEQSRTYLEAGGDPDVLIKAVTGDATAEGS